MTSRRVRTTPLWGTNIRRLRLTRAYALMILSATVGSRSSLTPAICRFWLEAISRTIGAPERSANSFGLPLPILALNLNHQPLSGFIKFPWRRRELPPNSTYPPHTSSSTAGFAPVLAPVLTECWNASSEAACNFPPHQA